MADADREPRSPLEPAAIRASDSTPALSLPALTEILACMPDALSLLDEAGRVVLANPPAEHLFCSGVGVSRALDGRLILAHHGAREAFAEALVRCARAAAAEAAVVDEQSLLLPRPGAQPLMLRLRPLRAQQTGVVALLHVADPDARRPLDSTALQRAYGLSPAEARLLQSLADGLSLKQIARRHDLSYETVRSYIKRVLNKTGARRQAELVRLIGALA